MKKKIALVGLGKVGEQIAAHIIRAGFDLTVYNRTSIKASKFSKKFKCRHESSLEKICIGADILILCLSTDNVVEKTTNQILKHLKPGSIIVDHSTINFRNAQKLHRKSKKHNIDFLDAPITGGLNGAKHGELTVMVGGSNSAFTKVKKILQSYSKSLCHMGHSGQGQLTKISNQIMVFNIKQGLVEGLSFADKHGIDRKKFVKVLLNGSAYSHQLKNNLKQITDMKYKKRRQYGIESIAVKELGIIIANLKRIKLRLPCIEKIAKILYR